MVKHPEPFRQLGRNARAVGLGLRHRIVPSGVVALVEAVGRIVRGYGCAGRAGAVGRAKIL